MRRRDFLALASLSASAGPMLASAESARLWRVGHISEARLSADTLENRLVELGHVKGRDFELKRLYLPPGSGADEAIRELTSSSDLLVVWSTLGAVAAKRLAPNLATIFLSVGDPVGIGLVQSLSHPGGNMTGVTFEAAMEAYEKRLELLRLLVPDLRRVAVLRAAGDPNVPSAMPAIAHAAETLDVVLQPLDFASEPELDALFVQMTEGRAQAVLTVASFLTARSGKRIAELALAHRLPSSSPYRQAVQDGALVSYGPDFLVIARQGAAYLDRIMRGARPAELPIELPDRYQTYLNLRTARTLGVQVPPSLLAIADEVIE